MKRKPGNFLLNGPKHKLKSGLSWKSCSLSCLNYQYELFLLVIKYIITALLMSGFQILLDQETVETEKRNENDLIVCMREF